jgi:hypothetical protein
VAVFQFKWPVLLQLLLVSNFATRLDHSKANTFKLLPLLRLELLELLELPELVLKLQLVSYPPKLLDFQ